MALIGIDEKILTGVKFFDENNKILIGHLNLLNEKIRNSTNKEELIKILREFEQDFINISNTGFSFMEMYDFANISYLRYLNDFQIKFIKQNNFRIFNGTKTITKEYLAQLTEIVFNNIAGDKGCVKMIQRDHKSRLHEIMSKIGIDDDEVADKL